MKTFYFLGHAGLVVRQICD